MLQACLRNLCTSTLPIQYALKYLDDFDLEAFVKELLDAILSQPYRGAMLRELSRYFSSDRDETEFSNEASASLDFKKLLAEAVEAQGRFFLRVDRQLEILLTRSEQTHRTAFTYAQLPPQEWHHGLRGYGPKVRSLLAYNLHQRNARCINRSAPLRLETEELTPYLSSFTRFGLKHMEISLSSPAPAAAEADAPDQDKTGIGAIQHVALRDSLYHCDSDYEVKKAAMRRDERLEELRVQRRNNLFGPRDLRNDQHIADVIVELLGPESKSGE